MHITKIALALPDTTRLIHGSHPQFLVRKKTFAYYRNNRHGDGIVALACKVLPRDNQRLTEATSHSFYLPAYIASRGWVALRLDRDSIDWDEFKELLSSRYVLIAPRKQAEALPEEECDI